MERTAVSSTSIKSVGYDAVTLKLEVEFENGGVYEYFDVPRPIYDSFMDAESLGQYFNDHIRDAYDFRQI